MTSIELNPAEGLRNPASVALPDIRTKVMAGDVSASLAVHHADIEAIRLSGAVPEPIAIQFETARNLYLYAWHVYRFYMVAKVQALTTLELGLRTYLPDRLPEPYQRPRQKQPMLAGMLGYAIDEGLVRNDGFRRWHEAAERSARQRRSFEIVRTMIDQQLEVIEHDEMEPLEITPEDQRWDLLSVLRESLPHARNKLAHGSTTLTNQVLGTIELVAEILGQLYPTPTNEGQP
ncbi:MAG: hypothetical protein AABZ19_11060 [Pseudomonadota bacterium]